MRVGSTINIRSFFEPKSIAVAGVSTDPSKLASIIFANLRGNVDRGILKASVYALNPAHSRIGGQPCYPTVRSLPKIPELLIIAVPVSLILPLVNEAAESGVKAAVIVTSGFAEVGRKDLESEIREAVSGSGMRILGPNTIGLLDTRSGVDSLFLPPTKTLPGGREIASLLKPLKGGVVIITQSGHLGEIISEELAASGVGVRTLVGTGNQLDVSIEDIIGYFADDEHAKVIALYIEGVVDGRHFMREAAKAAKRKPVVVLKVGKTSVGARAALTHTASMVGDYQTYQAAFRQCGLIEAADFQELVDFCVSFSMLPSAVGRRLVILTNAGGIGAIAADEAQKSGLDVSPMSDAAAKRIRAELGDSKIISNAALGNPIDLTASASTAEFVKATKTALMLTDYDLALILPTHQAPGIDYDVSARLSKVISRAGKPACVCVTGHSDLASQMHRNFLDRGIPSFPTPERAVRALSAVAAYRTLRSKVGAPVEVRKTNAFRTLDALSGPLLQPRIGELLRTYGIAQPKSVIVHSTRDLGRAKRVGFPVACKLLSGILVHKTEAGGVILDVSNRRELTSAFSRLRDTATERGIPFEGVLVQKMVSHGVEMIVGGARNPTFGPTVLFGVGGTYTELLHDYALAIAPVSTSEARDMIVRTRLSPVLNGYRGGPVVDLAELSSLISRFSRIMVENPSVEQIEINPLIATEHGLYAADARANVAAARSAPA